MIHIQKLAISKSYTIFVQSSWNLITIRVHEVIILTKFHKNRAKIFTSSKFLNVCHFFIQTLRTGLQIFLSVTQCCQYIEVKRRHLSLSCMWVVQLLGLMAVYTLLDGSQRPQCLSDSLEASRGSLMITRSSLLDWTTLCTSNSFGIEVLAEFGSGIHLGPEIDCPELN